MTQTRDSVTSSSLRDHAADALRRARRMPSGPARNDLRQLAIGLRSLEFRRRQSIEAALMDVLAHDMPLQDVPAHEVPLAPL